MTSTSIISDILVPVFSAAAGAFIGGWIAYLIAKHRFSFDNKDEGHVGLSAMQFALDEVVKASDKVIEVLGHTPENDKQARELLYSIRDKHKEGDRLRIEMEKTKTQWERYQDQILRCAMPAVIPNEENRTKYKTIHGKISELILRMDDYLKYHYDQAKKLKLKSDNSGEYEDTAIQEVQSTEFGKEISNAIDELKHISKTCKDISDSINLVVNHNR